MEFHASEAEARRAGFRPCRRCRPNEPALAERRAAAVAKACRLIERAAETPSLDRLAAAAGMSRFHFHRVFRAITGVTPAAYAQARRAARARDALARRVPVTEAIYEAGFNSSGRFYASSPAMFGMTPRKFRAGAKGVSMHFTIAPCSLGLALVAATDAGVCAILLGDDPAELVRDLRARFPHADYAAGGPAFERTVAAVVRLVKSPSASFSLPLDIRGTVFQQRVWQALRTIRAGTTVSYTDVAERIGAPRSVRAVAGACAANPIAVVVPCHRVVRSDGGLSGYRWGVERKRALLAREATSRRS